MQKLKLNLDDLRIESFETTSGGVALAEGMVYGMSDDTQVTCTGPSAQTCGDTGQTTLCVTTTSGCTTSGTGGGGGGGGTSANCTK